MRRPPRIAWLIVGGVAAVLVIAGVDALRSALSEAPSPPRADRPLINQFLSAMEKEIDAIREIDSQKLTRATHQKDALADRLSARWVCAPVKSSADAL